MSKVEVSIKDYKDFRQVLIMDGNEPLISVLQKNGTGAPMLITSFHDGNTVVFDLNKGTELTETSGIKEHIQDVAINQLRSATNYITRLEGIIKNTFKSLKEVANDNS